MSIYPSSLPFEEMGVEDSSPVFEDCRIQWYQILFV